MTRKLDLLAGLSRRSTRGAVSLEIVADKLEIDTEPSLAPIAEAIRSALHDAIAGINETGPDGHRLFNRTGRLREGLKVVALSALEWAVSAPGDRLSVASVRRRLAELVPALRDPRLLLALPSVQAAADKVIAAIVNVKKGTSR